MHLSIQKYPLKCTHIYLKVVSDWEERITFVESGLPGSHHDQAVLEYSDFGQKITAMDRLGNYFLLGDAG